MKRILSLALTCVFMCYACEEEKKEPKTWGEVTLSSEILGTNMYYVNAYSFEEDKYVPSMNSGSDIPDVIPQNIIRPNQDIIGMALSPGPENRHGFFKNYESSNLSEAQDFYSDYLEVNIGDFETLSDTLKAGQVYTFRTHKDNYVKFIVKEIRTFPGLYPQGYVEADIRYNIQRDGSEIFEE
ncbi:MAG: hypothetical protein ACOCZL_00550 [Bacteroidota bacterium]